LYLLNQKNGIHSVYRDKVNYIGWGESGKVILQVSIAVFWGAVEKIFGQRWLSPPRKIGPYAYAYTAKVARWYKFQLPTLTLGRLTPHTKISNPVRSAIQTTAGLLCLVFWRAWV